jgi:hypothetical protein
VGEDGLSIDERHERADFAGWLRPSGFPATRPDLLAMAEESAAPDWVIERLSTLDPDTEFETIGSVWEASRHAD